MLHKDSSKRPTIEQLKMDPFFAGINWDLLGQKRYRPPMKLDKPPKTKKDEEMKQELKEIFHNSKEQSNIVFTDVDYTEANKN